MISSSARDPDRRFQHSWLRWQLVALAYNNGRRHPKRRITEHTAKRGFETVAIISGWSKNVAANVEQTAGMQRSKNIGFHLLHTIPTQHALAWPLQFRQKICVRREQRPLAIAR